MKSALALALLPLLAPPNEKASLELKPEAGVSARYAVDHEVVTTMETMGMKVDLKIALEQDIELTAVERKDGLLHFDLTFRRIQGKIGGPMGSIEFDSDDPQDSYPGMFDAQVKQFVMRGGKSIRLAVTPKGGVKKVLGYSDIYDGTATGDALKLAGDPLTDESFIEDAQLFFARMPENPTAEGEKWTSVYKVSAFTSTIELNSRGTLKELTKKKATISYVGAHEAEKKDTEASAPEDDVDLEDLEDLTKLVEDSSVTGASYQGEFVVDRADGMVLSGESVRVAEAMVPSPFGGEPIPSSVTQTTKVRRIEASSSE